jgi:hypothetical protein
VVNRKEPVGGGEPDVDFGVSWNAALEGGGVLVIEKVALKIEISAIKNA